MREIVEVVSKISLASVTGMITSLIRTKLFALLLGTVGIGVTSQLINYTTFLVFVSSIGLPLGITKYISEWESNKNKDDITEVIGKSIKIMLIFSIISICSTIYFSTELSLLLFDSDSYALYLLIITFSIPSTLCFSILESLIRGLKKFNLYVKITIIISILNLIITVCLVYYFNIMGFVLSMILTSIVNFVLYFIYALKLKLIVPKSILNFDFSFSKPLKLVLKLGFVSLFVGAFEQITNLLIRSLIINNFNIEINGIYQCVAGISNNYFVIFYMSLGTYILPKLSGMKLNTEFNAELNNAFRFTVLVIVPIMLLVFVFRDYLIITLYSSKFLPASKLLVYSISGDFFKALAWVIGAWLIPKSKFMLFTLLALFSYITNIGLLLMLNYLNTNVENVVIAYAISSFIFFVMNYIVIVKFNDFSLNYVSKKILGFSVLISMIVLLLSNYSNVYGYFIIVPLLIIWIMLSVRLAEMKKFVKLMFK